MSYSSNSNYEQSCGNGHIPVVIPNCKHEEYLLLHVWSSTVNKTAQYTGLGLRSVALTTTWSRIFLNQIWKTKKSRQIVSNYQYSNLDYSFIHEEQGPVVCVCVGRCVGDEKQVVPYDWSIWRDCCLWIWQVDGISHFKPSWQQPGPCSSDVVLTNSG